MALHAQRVPFSTVALLLCCLTGGAEVAGQAVAQEPNAAAAVAAPATAGDAQLAPAAAVTPAPAGETTTASTDVAASATEAATVGPDGQPVVAAEEPKIPARPVEEELEYTSDGKIRFSFEGQRWIDVLQWYAKTAQLTLDWEEAPEAELNLSTQGAYTLDEARDLFNMHLATRGFTLLRRGEVLTLVKLEKLNPIIVPRVEQDELDTRDPHEIVRVSLPLDWLVAEDAVKEFTPMLSPFGKLLPMKATNRLEAMDTVVNLQEVRALLKREQSTSGEDRLIVEFKLKHTRAEEIIEKLRGLLGLENNKRVSATDRMRMQVERTKATAELAKNLGKDAQSALPKQPDVHLIVNEVENSVLANAPPDKLAMIRQAIQALDIPPSGNGRTADAATRMKIYRTKAIDPDAVRDLVAELVENGKLQSNTKVQADDNSNSVIVYASQEDHLAITSLIEQIDNDGRSAKVLPLTKLDPDYALQAVKLLLQGGSGNSDWGGWRRRLGMESFRIEADVERNRLLLWATDEEFTQVKDLLVQLGEYAAPSATARSQVRVLNLPSSVSQQAIEDLQRFWPKLRDNPLEINGRTRSAKRSRIDSKTSQKEDSSQDPTPAAPPAVRTLSEIKTASEASSSERKLAQLGSTSSDDEEDEEIDLRALGIQQADGAPEDFANQLASSTTALKRTGDSADAAAPAVTITQGADGRVLISSEDLDALDALEGLLENVLPPEPDYAIFHLQYASPISIELTLRQIFEAELKKRSAVTSRLPVAEPTTLQFISDLDTGTLLVQGATPEQLAKIENLVKLYDKPEQLDEELQRKTELYEVKHSRADAVAEAVKEVYRDLLSANDKAFAQNSNGRDSRSRDVGYVNYGSTIPKYKGLLSVAVEERTNTVIVSAPGFLIGEVMTLVKEVDERGAEQGVTVVRKSGIGLEQLRQVFSTMPEVVTGSSSTSSTPSASTPQPNRSGPQRSQRR